MWVKWFVSAQGPKGHNQFFPLYRQPCNPEDCCSVKSALFRNWMDDSAAPIINKVSI